MGKIIANHLQNPDGEWQVINAPFPILKTLTFDSGNKPPCGFVNVSGESHVQFFVPEELKLVSLGEFCANGIFDLNKVEYETVHVEFLHCVLEFLAEDEFNKRMIEKAGKE